MEIKDQLTLLISLSSLVVAGMALQSGWSRRQLAELSLEPAVALYPRIDAPLRTAEDEDAVVTFSWKVENTGGGPALVSRAFLADAEGNFYPMGSEEGWSALRGAIEDRFDVGDLAGYTADPPECPYAIAAPAEWPVITLSYFIKPEMLQKEFGHSSLFSDLGIDLGICYCSLTDDCLVAGTRDFPDEVCPQVADARKLRSRRSCPPAP